MRSSFLFLVLGVRSATAAIATVVFEDGPRDDRTGKGPEVREAQGFEMDNKLYVFGGFIPMPGNPNNIWNFMSKETWCWTPKTVGRRDGTWKRLADIPAAFRGVTHMGNTADVENGIIYLTGGLALPPGETAFSKSKGSMLFFAYHVDTDEWEELPNMNDDGTGPGGSGAGGAAFVNGELHVMSGATSEAPKDIFENFEPIKADLMGYHWALNIETMIWRQLEGPKISRNHLSVASLGTDIYAIGGQILRFEGCANEAVVEIFDTITETWRFGTPLPIGVGHASTSLITFQDHLLLLGGVNDNDGQCKPGGSHMQFGLVYSPGKGWTKIEGEIIDGATNVCGIMSSSGAHSMYCNTPDGVEFQRFQWTPNAPDIDYGFVPPLSNGEKTQLANFESVMAGQYEWRYRGKSGETSDIGIFCNAVENAFDNLRVTDVMDAIHTFSLRNFARFSDVTTLQDYAFKRFIADWVGVCIARAPSNDINFPMLMAVRRDFDTMISTGAIVNFTEHALLLNARSDEADACAFTRREVFGLYYRGAVSQLIANFMRSKSYTFDEAADFVCHSSTSIASLQADCDRAIGYARMLRAIFTVAGQPEDFMTLAHSRMPIEGSFSWLFEEWHLRRPLVQLRGSLSGDELRGAQEAFNLFVKFIPDNEFEKNWRYRHAFMEGLDPEGLREVRDSLAVPCLL